MVLISNADRSTVYELLNQSAPEVLIPNYQRSYSWTNEETEIFWKDIVGFYDRHPGEFLAGKEYFLGSIVGVSSTSPKRLVLLDGQQRIATTTILLSAIRDAFESLATDEGKKAAADTQSNYISYRLSRHRPQAYSITLNAYDREFFRTTIQNPTPAVAAGTLGNGHQTATGVMPARPKYASHKSILECRRLFDSKIAAAIAMLPTSEEKFDWIDQLREVVTHHLVFVLVESESEDDATEIFETLNDRGKDLSTIDLLRNFLLGKAESDEDREAIVEWWREIFSVSDNPSRIQSFLRHFWITRHGDVKARGLYKEIKSVLLTQFSPPTGRAASNPKKFSIEISTSAGAYSDLIQAETGNPRLDELLNEIKRLDLTPAFPVLLASVERTDLDRTVPLGEALISFFVRWSVIGRRESTVLEETLFLLAKELYGGMEINTALLRLRALAPQDDDFVRSFAAASVSKGGHQRHLLEGLEKAMRVKHQTDEVRVQPPSTVHIEHIYPQTPQAQYKLPDHEEWINRIGNLTLLHRRLNTRIKNGTFEQKVPSYSESILMVTKELESYDFWDTSVDPGRWNTNGIVARQQDLAAIAQEVWRV